jgi:uncharacterized membrane protein (UPF0136 family)
MAHIPVNHRLRPFYRGLAVLAGLYVLAFGIIGIVETVGDPFFDRGNVTVLGLKTNMAFSILSVLAGAVVLLAAMMGRNADHFINMAFGGLFMLVGVFGLTILRSRINLLNFTVATCVVSSLLGTALLIAGLYGKTGSDEEAQHEEELRVPSKAKAHA